MKRSISVKAFGILSIILGVLGIVALFFSDLFIFIDVIPWVLSIFVYPLIVLYLTIYTNYYSPPWAHFVAFPISHVYCLLLLISGIGLLKFRQWGYFLIIMLILLNFVFGMALSILASEGIIGIPFYIVLYSLCLWFFMRKSIKKQFYEQEKEMRK